MEYLIYSNRGTSTVLEVDNITTGLDSGDFRDKYVLKISVKLNMSNITSVWMIMDSHNSEKVVNKLLKKKVVDLKKEMKHLEDLKIYKEFRVELDEDDYDALKDMYIQLGNFKEIHTNDGECFDELIEAMKLGNDEISLFDFIEEPKDCQKKFAAAMKKSKKNRYKIKVAKEKNKDREIYEEEEEQTCSVTGRQGSGKTTMMSSIIRYIDPRYTIRVFGDGSTDEEDELDEIIDEMIEDVDWIEDGEDDYKDEKDDLDEIIDETIKKEELLKIEDELNAYEDAEELLKEHTEEEELNNLFKDVEEDIPKVYKDELHKGLIGEEEYNSIINELDENDPF